MKEFEALELVIHRNKKWLEPHEKQRFYLSPIFPLQFFKLPKELNYLTEKHIPLLRATLKSLWEKFIVDLMKELERVPLKK